MDPRHVSEPSPAVRRCVREMLERSDAFREMPPEERAKLARGLVQTLAYLTDPAAGVPEARGAAGPVGAPARALEDANKALKDRLADDPDQVGKNFKAGAVEAGTKAFKSMVAAVNFPAFVSGLIDGVYTSIVSSSIKQMQEYGKLLEAIVKSVEEFAQENISPDAARSFVASSFPRAVALDQGEGSGKLRLRDDVEDKDVPDFKRALGMAENVALDDDNETAIVLAAQLKMARQRQQQLATMVMLGINRIIVTEGEIKASVLFDMKAKDKAQRDAFASTSDVTAHSTSDDGGFFGAIFGGSSSVDTSVSSAYSEQRDRSASEVEAKAKLAGSVTVKFKSETFPLERLASSTELGAVQEKSAR